jgi:molecular chaperone DnaK
VKTEVQADVDALKTALQAEDDAAVQTAFDKLTASQTKLGEAIYASTQTSQNAEAPEDGEPAAEAAGDEDVVDAEIVDDEDEPKDDAKAPKK